MVCVCSRLAQCVAIHPYPGRVLACVHFLPTDQPNAVKRYDDIGKAKTRQQEKAAMYTIRVHTAYTRPHRKNVHNFKKKNKQKITVA